MKRIKEFLKTTIVIIPTVIITLMIFEKTKSYLYALLALVVTCSIMVIIVYFTVKCYKKEKNK